jgi:hypothetical protein
VYAFPFLQNIILDQPPSGPLLSAMSLQTNNVIDFNGRSSPPSGLVHNTCILKIEEPNPLSNHTIITEAPVTVLVGDTAIQITQTPRTGVWIKHIAPYMHRMDQFYKLWSEADNETRAASCRFMWIKYWVGSFLLTFSYPTHRS